MTDLPDSQVGVDFCLSQALNASCGSGYRVFKASASPLALSRSSSDGSSSLRVSDDGNGFLQPVAADLVHFAVRWVSKRGETG